MHREFHSRIFAEILDAIARCLLATSRTYLDACLRDRGVRALLLALQSQPEILSGVGT